LDHEGFVRRASELGLTAALLTVAGERAVPAAEAGVLGALGVPFGIRLVPDASSLEAAARRVEAAASLGARSVTLSLAGVCEVLPMPEVAAAARLALQWGQTLGLPVTVHGLPFCLLPEHQSALLDTEPLVDLDADGAATERIVMVQRPRCRSCALANRCPGAPAVALARQGEGALVPLGGRPVEDEGRATRHRRIA
jgi:hypothetical protein